MFSIVFNQIFSFFYLRGNSHATKKTHLVYERSCDFYPPKPKKIYNIEHVIEPPVNFVQEELSTVCGVRFMFMIELIELSFVS